MEECNICLTRIKKRYKNKHKQSKKHKYYYSNLVINKYAVNKNEFDNFEDIFKSNYIDHKKKFFSFNVLLVCKINEEVDYKFELPSHMGMTKKY